MAVLLVNLCMCCWVCCLVSHPLSHYLCVLLIVICFFFFFFQAEDGIRDLVRSRGLGDVYKRQRSGWSRPCASTACWPSTRWRATTCAMPCRSRRCGCLLYTSDAADDLPCVALGGRRILKKKKHRTSVPMWQIIISNKMRHVDLLVL